MIYKRSIFLIYILLFLKNIYAEDIPQFKLGDIPFGKTEQYIKEQFKSLNWNSDESMNELLDFEAIQPYFNNGLYTYYEGGSKHFNTNLVKTITLHYDNWGEISSMKLFFTKMTMNDTIHTLFMVQKNMKPENNNLQNTTQNIVRSISNRLGNTITKSTRYVNSNGWDKATITRWKNNDTQVFLLVQNSLFNCFPIFVYINNLELKKYIDSCLKYDKSKASQKSKAINNF